MTVGVVTDNQEFFREQVAFFSGNQPLAINDKWKAVTKKGTTIIRLRPNNIEVDSCAYGFNVLIFETPISLPLY